MPGNEGLNLVVITSFSSSRPLSVVNIQNVENAVWCRDVNPNAIWQRNFDEGVYEFGFYPDGAQECENLLMQYDQVSTVINDSRNKLELIGYPVKNIDGLCIGVKRAINANVEYYFLSDYEGGVASGFGYTINKNVIKLIESATGAVVSLSYTIFANFPTLIIPQSEGKSIYCGSNVDFINEYNFSPEDDTFLKYMSERLAFFNFETNNN